MELIHDPQVMREYVSAAKSIGESVAVVPTMGALHQGHLSLVRLAKDNCDRAVATIFVNPTQFAAGEDLDRYPRTLDQDLSELRAIGVDAVFVPDVRTMYPEGCTTVVSPPDVALDWEGSLRPEHFGGVCTIVLKLFQCIPCDIAVFGQKDYQQLRVIEAMVHDFNIPIKIISGAIIRDPDGLAMSSRNRYLSLRERERASSIPYALNGLKADVDSGQRDIGQLESQLTQRLLAGPPRTTVAAVAATNGEELRTGVDSIDYAVLVNGNTLKPAHDFGQPLVAIVAVKVGKTRLIDNCVIL